MADERHHDDEKRYPSSFKEAREQGGEALHGAHTIEDVRSDDSMNPQPVDLPEGTGTAVAPMSMGAPREASAWAE